MESEFAEYPWFALQVRAGNEKSIAQALKSKSYEPFLPLRLSRKRWSDRVKDTEISLFPGYLFCRFDVTRRLPIMTTPGVIRIVSNGTVFAPVDENEIAAIQMLVRSSISSQPWPYHQVGDRVRIEYGSLQGIEGILLDFKGQQRLILSVTLLQRSVAVEIDRAWVNATPLNRLPATPSLHPLN